MRSTVGEILADHVILEVSCVDRIYVNGDVAKLQTLGQLVYILNEPLGNPLASPALLDRLAERYREQVRRFVKCEQVSVFTPSVGCARTRWPTLDDDSTRAGGVSWRADQRPTMLGCALADRLECQRLGRAFPTPKSVG
jgi:hypothetical protein